MPVKLFRRAILLFDLVVFDLLHAGIADHADKAFVQDGIAGRLRLAVALDEGIGVEHDGLRRLVLDAVGDREHVTVIHRDLAVKDEALAIIVGERHGRGFRQRIAIGLPQCILPGQDKIRGGIGDEACLDIIGRGRTRPARAR